MTDKEALFPAEPIRFTAAHIEDLLLHCYRKSASDITLQTNEYIFMACEGQLLRVTQRRLSHAEITEILNSIYGQNGSAQILRGQDINTHYECRPNRRERYRFRVNGTGCLVEGQDGIHLSFRVIPTTPPTLTELALEPELAKALTPAQGVVYVTGATGSGKSTLLAAIIRELAERVDSHRKILTYESPIEFVYDTIEKPNSIVSQAEVPRHVPSFLESVRNALRRNPGLILIGEAPDRDTIKAVVEVGLTGHPVYTTVHSNGVAETMRRLVTAWPPEIGVGPIIDILETVRVIISQRLVPSTTGKRSALREFLIFDEKIRNILLETPVGQITVTIRRLLWEYGQPMYVDAERKFKAGIISEREFQRFKREE